MSFSAVSKMALRGFSGFEAMFRRSMAKKVNATSFSDLLFVKNANKISKYKEKNEALQHD